MSNQANTNQPIALDSVRSNNGDVHQSNRAMTGAQAQNLDQPLRSGGTTGAPASQHSTAAADTTQSNTNTPFA